MYLPQYGTNNSYGQIYMSEWKPIQDAIPLFPSISQNLIQKLTQQFKSVKLTPCRSLEQLLLVGVIYDSLMRLRAAPLKIIFESIPELTLSNHRINRIQAMTDIKGMLSNARKTIETAASNTTKLPVSQYLATLSSSEAQDVLFFTCRRLSRATQDKEQVLDICKIFNLSISVFYYLPSQIVLDMSARQPEQHITFVVYNKNKFFLAQQTRPPSINTTAPSSSNAGGSQLSQLTTSTIRLPGIPAKLMRLETGDKQSQQQQQQQQQGQQTLYQVLEQQKQQREMKDLQQRLQLQMQPQQQVNQTNPQKYPDVSGQQPQQQQANPIQKQFDALKLREEQKQKEMLEKYERDNSSQSNNAGQQQPPKYPNLVAPSQQNYVAPPSQSPNQQQKQQQQQQQPSPIQPQYQPQAIFKPVINPAISAFNPFDPENSKVIKKQQNCTYCSYCGKSSSFLYANPSCSHSFCLTCLNTVLVPDAAFAPCFMRPCSGSIDTAAITEFVMEVIKKQTSIQESLKIHCAYCDQPGVIDIDTRKPEYYKCSACSRISCLLHDAPRQLEKCFCKCPKCFTETTNITSKMKSCPRCKISKCTQCQKVYNYVENCKCKCTFCGKESPAGGVCPCTKAMCSNCLVCFDYDTISKSNPACCNQQHALCNPCYFKAVLQESSKLVECVFCKA